MISPQHIGRLITLIACSLPLVSGCVAPDRVVRTYHDTEYAGGPFSTILVVGAHEDSRTRRRFEDSVVRALRAERSSGISSITVMGADEPINRDTLVAAAQRTEADGVLITRLIDVQARRQVTEGRSTAAAVPKEGLGGFFRYDYVEYQDPMTVTVVRTVVLATDFYDVATESKIWSVESTSLDKESVESTIDGATRALSAALFRDGLIE